MKYAAVIVESRPLPNMDEIIKRHMDFLPDDWDTLHIKDVVIKGDHDYNRLLTSFDFWSDLSQFEKVLIFQHDSGLLRKGIEEFYHLDYVGAAWTWNNDHPGNGGLSLRTVDVMKTIAANYDHNNMNEDHWFTKKMFDHKIGRLATIEEADKFSIEQKYLFGSLGYHGIKNYFGEDQVEKILNQYK